mgnify:CR=1 FL=1|jgi:Tfp pilus assembly protein PilO
MMEPTMVLLLILGPAMVLVLVLGWRFFMAADKRELEEHERSQQAAPESEPHPPTR